MTAHLEEELERRQNLKRRFQEKLQHDENRQRLRKVAQERPEVAAQLEKVLAGESLDNPALTLGTLPKDQEDK